MRVAITGGTGFVGSHLHRRLHEGGHECVVLARGKSTPVDSIGSDDREVVKGNVTDIEAVRELAMGCDVIYHLAGINFERGEQTYTAVHVDGTRNVVHAAEDADVSKVVLTSYLRARPDCGSAYHETKWASEEIVRSSDVTGVVVKPGIIFGPGDQMLRNVGRSLVTTRIFPTIGRNPRYLRPVFVDDVVDVLAIAAVDDTLDGQTVPVVGPELLQLSELVERIGETLGISPVTVPLPVVFHRLSSRLQERVMDRPVITRAGLRMLREGATHPEPEDVCDELPRALRAHRGLTTDRIAAGLEDVSRFGLTDLRRIG